MEPANLAANSRHGNKVKVFMKSISVGRVAVRGTGLIGCSRASPLGPRMALIIGALALLGSWQWDADVCVAAGHGRAAAAIVAHVIAALSAPSGDLFCLYERPLYGHGVPRVIRSPRQHDSDPVVRIRRVGPSGPSVADVEGVAETKGDVAIDERSHVEPQPEIMVAPRMRRGGMSGAGRGTTSASRSFESQ